MNPNYLLLLFPLAAVAISCATAVIIVGLIMPSTRQALANWLHRRSLGRDDAESTTAQLMSANAQLAALRGEVYALRCEVAAGSQGLPADARPPALPDPMSRN